MSARYEAQAVTPWLANLSLTAYYQRTERLLQNAAAGAVPGAARRRSSRSACSASTCCSETEQRVWTPGVDVQAVIVPAKNHLLTTGVDVLP